VRRAGLETCDPGFGVQWEFADSDKEIARRVIVFLETGGSCML
jgi:hypothetical protein